MHDSKDLINGKVIRYSKKIESILIQYGAEGTGIHSYLNSLEDGKIDSKTIKELRWIATLRNNVVHNDLHLSDTEFKNFETACERSINVLKSSLESHSTINNIRSEEKVAKTVNSPKKFKRKKRKPKSINNPNDSKFFFNLSKKQRIIGVSLVVSVLTLGIFLSIKPNKAEIQNEIAQLNSRIVKLDASIVTSQNEMLHEKSKLESESNKQGLLRNIFMDTDEVNKLELKIDELSNDISKLSDRKENLVEKKKSLVEQLNELNL